MLMQSLEGHQAIGTAAFGKKPGFEANRRWVPFSVECKSVILSRGYSARYYTQWHTCLFVLLMNGKGEKVDKILMVLGNGKLQISWFHNMLLQIIRITDMLQHL